MRIQNYTYKSQLNRLKALITALSKEDKLSASQEDKQMNVWRELHRNKDSDYLWQVTRCLSNTLGEHRAFNLQNDELAVAIRDLEEVADERPYVRNILLYIDEYRQQVLPRDGQEPNYGKAGRVLCRLIGIARITKELFTNPSIN